jgi:hypothetical protein
MAHPSPFHEAERPVLPSRSHSSARRTGHSTFDGCHQGIFVVEAVGLERLMGIITGPGPRHAYGHDLVESTELVGEYLEDGLRCSRDVRPISRCCVAAQYHKQRAELHAESKFNIYLRYLGAADAAGEGRAAGALLAGGPRPGGGGPDRAPGGGW